MARAAVLRLGLRLGLGRSAAAAAAPAAAASAAASPVRSAVVGVGAVLLRRLPPEESDAEEGQKDPPSAASVPVPACARPQAPVDREGEA